MHAATHVLNADADKRSVGLQGPFHQTGPSDLPCSLGEVLYEMAGAELALHKLTRFSLLWGAGYVRNGGRLHLRFRPKHLTSERKEVKISSKNDDPKFLLNQQHFMKDWDSTPASPVLLFSP